MRIVTLIVNDTMDRCLKAEHGLSLYIETGEYKILFDVGQSTGFAENASKLGIDLENVDFAVLSHGHYDHGGGLQHFMQMNKKAIVYVSRHAFEPHYNSAGKFIGVDPAGLDMNRIQYVDDHLQIREGIELFSCNNRRPIVCADSYGQNMLENGRFLPDDYRHEQYLIINDMGNRICFSGCSHKGIQNIVHWFRPDFLIGGFHFMKIPATGEGKAILQNEASALLQGNTSYFTGHCTGKEQYAIIEEVLKERLQMLCCGAEVTI